MNRWWGVIATGVIGFAAVVLVFTTADAIAGRPILYTPALLGGALFYGVTSPSEVIIAPAPVLAYTAVHLFAFLVLGALAAGFASIASRHRHVWFLLVNLFILVLTHASGVVLTLTESLQGVVSGMAGRHRHHGGRCRDGGLSALGEPAALARAARSGVSGVVSGPRGRWLRPRVASAGLLATVAALTLTLGCLVAEARAERPKVAATIFPLYDIVRQVADPVADVVLVLPPGASPHTFEPTPSGVRALEDARVLFVIGHGLDDWAAKLARGAAIMRLAPVDAGIRLRREPHGGVDPHYWLSVPNAKAIARTVAAELTRLAPDRRGEIDGAVAAYLVRLDAADAEIRRLLADLPTRRIATFHDAFSYFAEAYGLGVVATFEPYPGLEPSPRFVIEFQRSIRAAAVRVVFTEPQLSIEALRPIARDLGVTLAVLDPLGGLPGRESYIDLLLFDARAVAAATRGRTP